MGQQMTLYESVTYFSLALMQRCFDYSKVKSGSHPHINRKKRVYA